MKSPRKWHNLVSLLYKISKIVIFIYKKKQYCCNALITIMLPRKKGSIYLILEYNLQKNYLILIKNNDIVADLPGEPVCKRFE